MSNLLQNKAVKIIGLILLLIFLPFIPVGFLIYKSYKKLSGIIRIAAISILGVLLFFSLMWSLAFVAAIKSPSTPSKNLEPVQNTSPSPTLTPSPNTTPNNPNIQLFEVTQVIDGDTIQVVIDNKKETIRLIGIDSPETVDPRKPVQCFGKEASAKAKSLLSGKSVRLESDPTQGERDKYQRLLRYVFLKDGANFNKLMISEGYAHEYTYNIPYKYQSEFKQAQKEAEENKRGLWADNACPTATPQPSPTNTSTSGGSSGTTGTSGSSGEFTCAGKTKCGQMSSCAEAEFYLNTCGVSRLDGDKDGIPCESLCN